MAPAGDHRGRPARKLRALLHDSARRRACVRGCQRQGHVSTGRRRRGRGIAGLDRGAPAGRSDRSNRRQHDRLGKEPRGYDPRRARQAARPRLRAQRRSSRSLCNAASVSRPGRQEFRLYRLLARAFLRTCRRRRRVPSERRGVCLHRRIKRSAASRSSSRSLQNTRPKLPDRSVWARSRRPSRIGDGARTFTSPPRSRLRSDFSTCCRFPRSTAAVPRSSLPSSFAAVRSIPRKKRWCISPASLR